MHAKAHDRHASIVERLEAWWQDWRLRHRQQVEFSAIDGIMREQLSRDAGVASVEELVAVVAHGPRGAALLSEMAQALGVDLDELKARQPQVLREMAVSCTMCDSKQRCVCELEEGTAAVHAGEFCNNAEVFAALKR